MADVKAAESKGDVSVEQTDVILNAAMVKWSSGGLEVDPDLKMYHGGQIIEAPDTSTMTVTFKLNECFPGTRCIVTDHSIQPAAEATKTIFAPGLQEGPSKAGATGRTNVFMNGLPGPGPMEFQPSAFDYPVGDAGLEPLLGSLHIRLELGKDASAAPEPDGDPRGPGCGRPHRVPGRP